jgi:hypothetical protein
VATASFKVAEQLPAEGVHSKDHAWQLLSSSARPDKKELISPIDGLRTRSGIRVFRRKLIM